MFRRKRTIAKLCSQAVIVDSQFVNPSFYQSKNFPLATATIVAQMLDLPEQILL